MRWLCVFALLVAGCSDPGGAAAPDDPFDDLEAEVSSDRGVIRGIVIDPTITPIEGATVRLQDGTETTSNEEGAFLLADLEPGVHFLTVSKLGYSEVQQSAEVVAGIARPPSSRCRSPRSPAPNHTP